MNCLAFSIFMSIETFKLTTWTPLIIHCLFLHDVEGGKMNSIVASFLYGDSLELLKGLKLSISSDGTFCDYQNRESDVTVTLPDASFICIPALKHDQCIWIPSPQSVTSNSRLSPLFSAYNNQNVQQITTI